MTFFNGIGHERPFKLAALRFHKPDVQPVVP
jgi:hypothetical protein